MLESVSSYTLPTDAWPVATLGIRIGHAPATAFSPKSEETPLSPENGVVEMTVLDAWNRLSAISELRFDAKSRSAAATGWTGAGRGIVQIDQPDVGTTIFHETGVWTPEGGREIAFSNVFRWTLDTASQHIRLEHLRFGPENPVYLFDLIPVAGRVLESAKPHACHLDCYEARMEFDAESIKLGWAVVGPSKDERIVYTYR